MKTHSFPPHFVIKDGIHGLGVITTIPVKEGELLFKLEGEVINTPTRTSIQISENQHIESVIGSHINHSCFPTGKVDRATQSLISLRDIRQGEEITFDYHDNEDKMAAPFRCHCCGKKIVGKLVLDAKVK